MKGEIKMDEHLATCSVCGLNFDETEINMDDHELDLCSDCEQEYIKVLKK